MDAGWSLVDAGWDVERAPAERVFATPHPSLADHVLTCTAHDFPDSEAFPWRIAPLGAVTVTIDLAAPPLRRTPAASPVMGLRDRPLVIEQGGANRGIIVALTPAVADEIGWTRQHLSTRFREQVGLTPKAVARIARLHRAVTLLNHPSALPLAEVAHRCGYTDQPHLNRDFRALTGCTPTEYR
ncbi:AraC family transcriptional regulator [Actinokineospora spheciospongiae]|uniref:AraC family transcriptional regulator n=1 Tax=Actinokineospora spheciospongiae TaxID=909613 RepID=UPI001F3C67A9|nr:helix-turn-helix domain-containing protein [Actinokineospora spheciospongiae]